MSTTTEKFHLASMPSAQCHVNITTDSHNGYVLSVSLFSYATEVCCLTMAEDDSVTLWCSGTYSVTTARHINRFTQEFCGKNLYHECKYALSHADKLPHMGDFVQVATGIHVGLVGDTAYDYLENTGSRPVRKFYGHY